MPHDMTLDAFHFAYRSLEQEMKDQAEGDGCVFLPSAAPAGPVDYVLICMEPSLGSTSADHVREHVEAGGRNFLSSIEDFILHFSARNYLCGPTQRYHVTDWSKGAMRVAVARAARDQRYTKWYPFLLEEIELVAAPNAGFIAVGAVVAEELQRRNFRRPLCRVIHYSGQAARARKKGIAGREPAFEDFRDSVSLKDLLVTAEEILRSACVPTAIRDETLTKLEKRQLTTSRKQLIFNYKVAFESFRTRSGIEIEAGG